MEEEFLNEEFLDHLTYMDEAGETHTHCREDHQAPVPEESEDPVAWHAMIHESEKLYGSNEGRTG